MSKKHGANLFDLSKQYNFDINKILDFSSNINPFGADKKALDYISKNLDIVSIYPDPEYIDLKSAISEYCQCQTEDILLSNGATSLISNYIKYVSPKKALLLQPAYSEYESELNESGAEILRFFLKKEQNFKIDIDEMVEFINKNEIELAIICNPNNPTGTILSRNEIETLLNKTTSKFMVDETYIEFSNKETFSSAPLTSKYSNLFVIRGTSKFFATPGIRLGYSITSDIGAKSYVNKSFHLWDINVIASTMGEIMFKNNEYIENTHLLINNEMNYLKTELSQFQKIKAYPSHGNFILCEILCDKIDANSLYTSLIKKGIAIRNCSSFNGLGEKFFRVCVLNHEANFKLIDELKILFK